MKMKRERREELFKVLYQGNLGIMSIKNIKKIMVVNQVTISNKDRHFFRIGPLTTSICRTEEGLVVKLKADSPGFQETILCFECMAEFHEWVNNLNEMRHFISIR